MAEPKRVVIAGAGVAGLEALLALRALADDRVRIELIAPTDRFVHRPLLVAEPFGVATATTLDVGELAGSAGAVHRRDALAAVDAGERLAITEQGERVPYDALIVAVGARPVEAVPGALTFSGAAERRRFGEVLGTLGRRGSASIAFVVPREATWTIAAYELAMLTAAERDARRIPALEIALVTSEPAPLAMFGDEVAARVGARLAEAGITIHSGQAVESFAEGKLRVAGGARIPAAHAVALPGLEVAPLPGLPQREHGFVHTDTGMNVMGMEHVWAAGDVSSFPIKQGGIAAQQADVAARSIAASAGAHVPLRPFQPVLRAALITGSAPEYLRARAGAREGEAVTGRTLWWPPAKVAGLYLARYLAPGESRGTGTLIDLDEPPDVKEERDEHREAVTLVLAAAEADAHDGDFAGALAWLALIEELDLVIPAEYVVRRYEWRRALEPAAEPDAATRRIEPAFAGAAAALSDLERRLGWLRASEAKAADEMRGDLRRLDHGMEDLKRMARAAKIV